MANMKIFAKIDGCPGSTLDSKHKDFCDVRGFEHELQYPFDMRENKGRGEPVHGALTITTEVDKATPKLFEALAKKKKIKDVQLEFWRDKPGEGGSELYFKIKIEDCRVVVLKVFTPKASESDKETPPHQVQVGFAYRKIDTTYDSGGQVPTTFDFSDPTK